MKNPVNCQAIPNKATPGQKAPSKGPPIQERHTTSEAFGRILRYNLDFLLEWAPIAYKGEDIEGVHQARVGLRRLRSALGLFRKALPREYTDSWGTEMQWIATAMGEARDLDVFISEGLKAMAGKIPLASGEQKLTVLATQRRNEAYANVRIMLDSNRYKTFVTDFAYWVDNRGWNHMDVPNDVRHELDKSIRMYASKLLNKRMRTTLAFGAEMGTMSTEELHELRIECKKLRYAIDFFQPIFVEKGIQAFTLHLKGLQDLLGIMNDVTVMHGLLDKMLQHETDIETMQYAGALIGWRAHQYEEVRGELDVRWNEFASAALPWMK